MHRRGFVGALIAFVLMPWRRVRARPTRLAVPPILWYENDAGEKWIPTADDFDHSGRPAGFHYQWSQFPRQLEENCHGPDGHMMTGHSSWPEDLVLAMTADYTLSDAILIAAHLCERCLNAAAYDYGLTWGYRRGSPGWLKANTTCPHCQ